ncbi:uncharacterized protein LOC122968169 [Thunnus albacares]|uniref:uncharacterized protein LOC122968169 n=1 Tax=Thunnus albacares TaxID=8236 RepID=UPI001CF69600|nr:uncharacterized protein LOC122968169 [Thunnus albacares]
MALSTERSRRWSKDMPPDLSELMNKLTEHAASFIRLFDNDKPKMRHIVRRFQEIAAEVREMQETTDGVRTAGAVGGGVGVGVGLLALVAAPFTGGASLVVAAGAAGTAAAVGGAATVVGANISKTMKEKGSAEKVEELGKEFMEIVEPLKNKLQEIKTTCEKLEQRSTEALTDNTLSDVREFHMILGRVSKLKEKSEDILVIVLEGMGIIHNLILFLLRVFRVTATPEEDKKLRDSILQSADQCQKVVNEFDKMKNELGNFTESKETKNQ